MAYNNCLHLFFLGLAGLDAFLQFGPQMLWINTKSALLNYEGAHSDTLHRITNN
jgi:hypothetical protein